MPVFTVDASDWVTRVIHALLPAQIAAYARMNGPTPEHFERAAAFVDQLPDPPQIKGNPEQVGQMLGGVVNALAVLAFVEEESAVGLWIRAEQLERWVDQAVGGDWNA